MSTTSCTSCLTAKAPLTCIHCQSSLCKSCAVFVDENSYPYLNLFQKSVAQGAHCPSCYQEKTQEAIEDYNVLLKRAQNLEVFYRRINGKETRLMKRIDPLVVLENCLDEKDILIRLAFVAVQRDAECVVDIEVFSEKQKEGSYSLVTWRGSGFPAMKR